MSDNHSLSGLQLLVMRAVWTRGEATVAEVHSDLSPERGLALTTIATIISRLEKRGLLAHREKKRPFAYVPLVTEADVKQSMLSEFAEQLFQGDTTELVAQLLNTRDLAAGDLDRVKALIESKKKELGRKRAR